MNFRKNQQHDFQKMRGGGQWSFGTFPKIHPFLKRQASLRVMSPRCPQNVIERNIERINGMSENLKNVSDPVPAL